MKRKSISYSQKISPQVTLFEVLYCNTDLLPVWALTIPVATCTVFVSSRGESIQPLVKTGKEKQSDEPTTANETILKDMEKRCVAASFSTIQYVFTQGKGGRRQGTRKRDSRALSQKLDFSGKSQRALAGIG
jgi:hypothetical protein